MNTKCPPTIEKALDQFKQDMPIARVLLAAEAGSRLWGFATDSSDYDLRLIFTRHRKDYLSFSPIQNTYDRQSAADCTDTAGWDLRKACLLAIGGNANLYDWLYSPITYINASGDGHNFQREMRQLFEHYCSYRELAFSHFGLAKKHYARYIDTDSDEVKIKTYIYTLRALLCVKFILVYDAAPPVNMHDLIDSNIFSEKIERLFADLILERVNFPERKIIPKIDDINFYIKESLDKLKPDILDMPKKATISLDYVDNFFLRWCE